MKGRHVDRRADKTGRSTSIYTRKHRELISPPTDEQWSWMPESLYGSDALRDASKHCRRFLDFLQREHLRHGGAENGNLAAPYEQLRDFGIPQKRISGAIREAVKLGLVTVTEKGGLFGIESRRTPSRYRINWIGTTSPCGYAGNQWKGYRRVGKNQSPLPTVGTAEIPLGKKKSGE